MTTLDTSAAGPAAPSLVLGCLGGTAAGRHSAAAWREALAPEVMLRLADADAGTLPGACDGVPYALLAVASSGARAARLAQSLLATDTAPVHLLLFQCPDPVPLPVPLACRLTVFADARQAGAAASWRASCTGEFTLRVLRDPVAVPPFGPVSPDLVLAVKEELGVWPY